MAQKNNPTVPSLFGAPTETQVIEYGHIAFEVSQPGSLLHSLQSLLPNTEPTEPSQVQKRKRIRFVKSHVKVLARKKKFAKAYADRMVLVRQDRLERENHELRIAVKAVQEAHDEELSHLKALMKEVLEKNESLELQLSKWNNQDKTTARTVASLSEEAAQAQWAVLVKRGEQLKLDWVTNGLLVRTAVLTKAWGRSRQALEQACKRGDLFSIKMNKNTYYPSIFTNLDADVVKAVCSALMGKDAVAKFVFLNKPHGSLGGKTPAAALNDGQLNNVIALAEGWSEEHGLTN